MANELVRRTRRPWWMTPFGREPFGDIWQDRIWPEWQRDLGEEWTPSMNFYEKEGKYFLTSELPGISKDDISINVDNGTITITGKKESSKEEEGASYYLKETSFGSFSRSFRLPGEVEEEGIEASMKDGVLTIEMPKKEEPKAKKISVK